jgi:hypothetical protein
VPDWRRLLSHVLLDRVQVAWRSRLLLSGVQQEVQAALVGLQLQVRCTGCTDAFITTAAHALLGVPHQVCAALIALQLKVSSSCSMC